MYQYVIWDFNGTILDDLDLCLDLLNQMLIKQSKPILTVEAYKNVFGFPIKDYYIQAGLTFDDMSFDELSQFFIERYQPASFQCKIHHGVIETLNQIKSLGINSIILSASQTDNLIEQTKVLNIYNYFEHIVGTDNIKGQGKVERGISFMKNANINPNTCIYVGDTIHDAEVAKALGVKVLLYAGGHQSESRLRTANERIIYDFSDIINLIKG
jgi:phosphoglycolate phosphatase